MNFIAVIASTNATSDYCKIVLFIQIGLNVFGRILGKVALNNVNVEQYLDVVDMSVSTTFIHLMPNGRH